MEQQQQPKVGQEIYVPTSLFLSHGRDDFAGGLVTINRIENTGNGVMVGIKEQPNWLYNWTYLLRIQGELQKQFGTQRGHRDPDLSDESNDDW